MFSHIPRLVQLQFIHLWPPTELAPPQVVPPMYQTPSIPSGYLASSSRTPPVGLPPFPYPAPFGAPPSVGQAYPPVGPPPFQYSTLYPLQPAPAAYTPAQWPPYPQAPWAPYPLYYPY